MIEFKAECGHTVRAKDEDAGGVVRCSYCGREAGVPDGREDDLDFLFKDVEQGGEAVPARKKKKRSPRKPRTKRDLDPFPIIIRLVYAAVIISIVIFVGNKYLLPAFRDGQKSWAERDNKKEPSAKTTKKQRHGTSAPKTNSRGLNPPIVPAGLYVCSTPSDASAFYMLESDAPASGRIYRLPAAKPIVGQLVPSVRNDGNYVVEVALPIRNKSLKRFPDYLEFRRELEQASQKERNAMARDYFLDDGAEVLVDEANGQHYIVRQYRAVEIRRGRSSGVRALFLPRISDDNGDLLLEEIIKYVPSPHRYLFDTEDVESELEFYEVPRGDRTAVVEALARVGTISYRVPDGNMRLFAINIHDGSFSAQVLGR